MLDQGGCGYNNFEYVFVSRIPSPETFLRWYPVADETYLDFVGGSHISRVKIRTKFPGLAIWYPVPAMVQLERDCLLPVLDHLELLYVKLYVDRSVLLWVSITLDICGVQN